MGRNGGMSSLYTQRMYPALLLLLACSGPSKTVGDPCPHDASPSVTWYADADKDGYGNPDEPVRSCDDQPPDGFVDDASDCDDADSRVNPAASEVCDSYDDDCDGLVDGDDADLSGGAVYYADTDDDGYGDPAVTAPGCWAAPEGFVDDDTDCDDADAATSPAATELCNGYDDDCDDLVDSADPTVADEGMTWFDSDGDGYGDTATSETACVGGGRVALPGDCDDTDPAVNPDALEVCDELDNDCDALVDAADGSLESGTAYYADGDADGYGDALDERVECSPPAGFVTDSADCDDANAEVNPAAQEVCGGLDDDCDGLVDNEDDDVHGAGTTWLDADGDGYGDAATEAVACAGAGRVGTPYDCDDTDAAISPAAQEVCNGIDDDCDERLDDADFSCAGLVAGFEDADGDGYGASSVQVRVCTLPSGYVADNTDCDDAVATNNPAGVEVCDAVDNDCDGLTDGEDDSITDATTWYEDHDRDGYGSASHTDAGCSAPPGYVADNTDCVDADADISPAATETCDSQDNDCDGLTDDDDGSLVGYTWFADADGDGRGDAGATTDACALPTGYTADNNDCDDSDPSVGLCPSQDDGTVCWWDFGNDNGRVPQWTGTCDTTLGFVEYGGHCYFPDSLQVEWNDARASCVAAGGYLTTLGDVVENAFVISLGVSDGDSFSGGCRETTIGPWMWITGETWAYERFTRPTVWSDPTCLATYSNGTWDPVECDIVAGSGYVCEFE